jgi:hypothetical protein
LFDLCVAEKEGVAWVDDHLATARAFSFSSALFFSSLAPETPTAPPLEQLELDNIF